MIQSGGSRSGAISGGIRDGTSGGSAALIKSHTPSSTSIVTAAKHTYGKSMAVISSSKFPHLTSGGESIPFGESVTIKSTKRQKTCIVTRDNSGSGIIMPSEDDTDIFAFQNKKVPL